MLETMVTTVLQAALETMQETLMTHARENLQVPRTVETAALVEMLTRKA